MTWTTETPTVEGWYWWHRANDYPTPRPVLLRLNRAGTLAVDHDGFLYQSACDLHGEWSGPLEPPGEAST